MCDEEANGETPVREGSIVTHDGEHTCISNLFDTQTISRVSNTFQARPKHKENYAADR
jgi:hypothetical protein